MKHARFAATSIAVLTLVLTTLGFGAVSANAAVECADPGASPGVPAISLTKEQPAERLYANSIPITLTAAQPVAPPAEWGFNLSFRDVLPPGVSYKAGSSSIAPQVIANSPAPGYTTLIFANVADLAPGSEKSLRYEAAYSPLDFDTGDTITTGDAVAPQAAGAYVNCNPRWLPLFDGQGMPIVRGDGHSFTGSAAVAPQSTLLTALEIEKSEPSPEHELMRGVHSNQTTYTLTVRNNTINATDNVKLVDYLPAGLEFLGCGTADNTTEAPTNSGSAEEYPRLWRDQPGQRSVERQSMP